MDLVVSLNLLKLCAVFICSDVIYHSVLCLRYAFRGMCVLRTCPLWGLILDN